MSPDFRELLSTFSAHGVDYIVVGAHALAAHGHVRATKDLDVWVKPGHENAAKVLRALAEFGAPLQDLSVDDLPRVAWSSAPGGSHRLSSMISRLRSMAQPLRWEVQRQRSMAETLRSMPQPPRSMVRPLRSMTQPLCSVAQPLRSLTQRLCSMTQPLRSQFYR